MEKSADEPSFFSVTETPIYSEKEITHHMSMVYDVGTATFSGVLAAIILKIMDNYTIDISIKKS